VRNEKGRLENAPYVDNSYKWAGGGFLSTVDDLVKFGNAMLYSFQRDDGFLKKESVNLMWSCVANTEKTWDQDGLYGMGWGVVNQQTNYPFCNSRSFCNSDQLVGIISSLMTVPPILFVSQTYLIQEEQLEPARYC